MVGIDIQVVRSLKISKRVARGTSHVALAVARNMVRICLTFT